MFKEHKEILITLIAGVLLILFLVSVFILSIVRNKQRVVKDLKEKLDMKKSFDQTLLQSQIEVQEATLSSLSQELHDNIGQLLSSAKMLLGITERNFSNPPDTLITASETVGKAINELRSLSKSLSKEWLEQFDLTKNLEAEVERVNSAQTMKIRLEHPGKLTIKADEQIILFRIIQEAIQNTIKHAHAMNVSINIQTEGNLLLAVVKDDGNGFNQNSKAHGMGIINMKHRSKLLGGSIEWSSNNQGSTVLIKLPFKTEEQ